MPMEIRFHLDESIDPDIARALRARGIDVTTAQETDLLEALDPEHLAFAHSRGRVLVTHDADFLRLHAQGIEHAGMCYCHPQARTLGQIIDLLVCGCLKAEEMKQHVEFL